LIYRIELPSFLKEVVELDKYCSWIDKKAKSLQRRDRKKGIKLRLEKYRGIINDAVLDSKGKDAYTGETLEWHKILKYNNSEAEEQKSDYKKAFYMLPTIDHNKK